MRKLLNQLARWVVHHFNFKCASTVLAVTVLLYIVVYLIWSSPASFSSREKDGLYQKNLIRTHLRHNILQPKSGFIKDVLNLNIMPDGEGVWIKDRQIQVMSAFYDMYYNDTTGKRFIMPTFIQHSVERRFVCCFSTFSEPLKYEEVPAEIEYIDLRFLTVIQNGAFECILKGKEIQNPDLVSFAPESCQSDVTFPFRVIYPIPRKFEFAVCTKVAYGRLDPQKLLEWFEFMREIGASKIITFYTELHPDSKAVFDFYVARGLLTIIPFKPKGKEGIEPIQYSEDMAQTRHARQEKTLAVRDCQFRLSGYNYVLTIDFDEIPVPIRPFSSLLTLFESLMEEYKDASAFRMDPILLPPEWNAVKRSNWLYYWRFHTGTYIAGHCIKWIYIPSRIKIALTHKIIPKSGFKNYVIPQDYLHFLHFRTCKRERWHEVDCDNLTMSVTNEMSLKRYLGPVIRSIRGLPLEDLVPDEVFVQSMRRDSSSSNKETVKR